MTEVVTAKRMRAIEAAAMESGAVSGFELMERAGQAVVEAIFEAWPALAVASEDVPLVGPQEGGAAPRPSASPRGISGQKKTAVVLCGPGNNGGDGFVVARLLFERGWAVQVFLHGDASRLPQDARAHFEAWCGLGEVLPLTLKGFRAPKEFADVYVDALFGTGLSRPPEGEAAAVLRHMSGMDGDCYWDRTIAVDAPSGLCIDSGRHLWPKSMALSELFGEEVAGAMALQVSEVRAPAPSRRAKVTVTFDSPKIGHFIAEGPITCGGLVVKDIGIEKWRCFKGPREGQPPFVETKRGRVGVLRPQEVTLICKAPLIADLRDRTLDYPNLALRDPRLLSKGSAGHKFKNGHALIFTGGFGKTGAARLAAESALRVGAGLVTLGVPPAAQMEVACQITALMMTRIDDAQAVEAALSDQRINALCLGPGLGHDAARALLPAALTSGRSVVLDADALSAFEEAPQTLFAMLHAACVLTPHGGEFRRLFPDLAERLAAPATAGPAFSKVDAARLAAQRAGCTVLLKGADTVIAQPNGLCAIHSAHYERSAPWLATAGAGDVLAGLITGLLARGFAPFLAACTGAWLHVECARRFGPGLTAEDLPEQLPAVLRDLLGPTGSDLAGGDQ